MIGHFFDRILGILSLFQESALGGRTEPRQAGPTDMTRRRSHVERSFRRAVAGERGKEMGQDKKKEKKSLKAEELEKRAAPFSIGYTDGGGGSSDSPTGGTDTMGGDDTTMSGNQTGKGKGLHPK